MGATPSQGGVIFRTWAPTARDVYVVTDPAATNQWCTWTPDATDRLIPLGDGTWAGFVPGLGDGDPYLFWVRGPEGGSEGFKRDPYARELAIGPEFPNCPCLVRDARTYVWHDAAWRPPAFHEFVIYQLHVGAFWAVDAQGRDQRRQRYGAFLDVIERIDYLRDLGINAIQLLPIQEYAHHEGLGYAGLDFFSPEMSYEVEDVDELARHLAGINGMLAASGLPALQLTDIDTGPNQLKCLVDMCHLNGIAVLFDLVYNHAGGDFGDRDLWFFDRQPGGDANRSLYFSDQEWAGGMVFAYWQAPVRQFLIDNAVFCLNEYHIDGGRYDEITVINSHGGTEFCRNLTDIVRSVCPQAVQIAEYWGWDRALPVTPAQSGGLGFDAAIDDRLRNQLRAALADVCNGADAPVNLDGVRDALYPPPAYPAAWCSVQHLENHDVVLWDVWHQKPRDLRIALRADPSDARSWYARSRARVATALLMTAPGIPMLFMGQEILEDKPWCDDVSNWPQFLVWWDGLRDDRHMRDFQRFVRDLVWVRRSRPALCGEGSRVSQVHNDDRVIVMHRWVEGAGRDVVVVASLNERTLDGYLVDLPWPGQWQEIFNSDYYDHFPNDQVAGNGGTAVADQAGRYGYPFAARIRLPANAALILARDA